MTPDNVSVQSEQENRSLSPEFEEQDDFWWENEAGHRTPEQHRQGDLSVNQGVSEHNELRGNDATAVSQDNNLTRHSSRSTVNDSGEINHKTRPRLAPDSGFLRELYDDSDSASLNVHKEDNPLSPNEQSRSSDRSFHGFDTIKDRDAKRGDNEMISTSLARDEKEFAICQQIDKLAKVRDRHDARAKEGLSAQKKAEKEDRNDPDWLDESGRETRAQTRKKKEKGEEEKSFVPTNVERVASAAHEQRNYRYELPSERNSDEYRENQERIMNNQTNRELRQDPRDFYDSFGEIPFAMREDALFKDHSHKTQSEGSIKEPSGAEHYTVPVEESSWPHSSPRSILKTRPAKTGLPSTPPPTPATSPVKESSLKAAEAWETSLDRTFDEPPGRVPRRHLLKDRELSPVYWLRGRMARGKRKRPEAIWGATSSSPRESSESSGTGPDSPTELERAEKSLPLKKRSRSMPRILKDEYVSDYLQKRSGTYTAMQEGMRRQQQKRRAMDISQESWRSVKPPARKSLLVRKAQRLSPEVSPSSSPVEGRTLRPRRSATADTTGPWTGRLRSASGPAA